MSRFEKEFGVSPEQIGKELVSRAKDDAAIAKAVSQLLPLCDGIAQTVFIPLADGRIASVRVTIVDGSAKEADLPQAVGTPADVQIQATGKGKTYTRSNA